MTTTPLKATMQVPLLDLKAQYADIKTEIDQAVHRVLDSARFIGGPEVSGLEEEIARYCRTPHAIACASGTDALLLALRALDIGPGDEVVTTAFSFFASAGAIVNAGARPVFVDIDPRTFNLDVHRLEAAITPLTKAVLPVHLYGQCSDLGALKAVCDKRQLYLIEDAAQAIGSEWEGKRAGSVGDLGCFSFFPSKNLGAAGDGGLVTALDAALAERVRLLREHGAKPKYYHALVGTNSRLDALQAAILRVKLHHLDRWSEARQDAALYDQLFEGARLTRPFGMRARATHNQYVIRVPGATHCASTSPSVASAPRSTIPCRSTCSAASRRSPIAKATCRNRRPRPARSWRFPSIPSSRRNRSATSRAACATSPTHDRKNPTARAVDIPP
jgi:dTDP-4-amino-4,6-dideoxygalactose transaminase